MRFYTPPLVPRFASTTRSVTAFSRAIRLRLMCGGRVESEQHSSEFKTRRLASFFFPVFFSTKQMWIPCPWNEMENGTFRRDIRSTIFGLFLILLRIDQPNRVVEPITSSVLELSKARSQDRSDYGLNRRGIDPPLRYDWYDTGETENPQTNVPLLCESIKILVY